MKEEKKKNASFAWVALIRKDKLSQVSLQLIDQNGQHAYTLHQCFSKCVSQTKGVTPRNLLKI